MRQYHTVPGTDTVIPIMSLGDGLQKMNLKDKCRREDDPVADAAKRGKVPTLKDVKKSVKVWLRSIHLSHLANYQPRPYSRH